MTKNLVFSTLGSVFKITGPYTMVISMYKGSQPASRRVAQQLWLSTTWHKYLETSVPNSKQVSRYFFKFSCCILFAKLMSSRKQCYAYTVDCRAPINKKKVAYVMCQGLSKSKESTPPWDSFALTLLSVTVDVANLTGVPRLVGIIGRLKFNMSL